MIASLIASWCYVDILELAFAVSRYGGNACGADIVELAIAIATRVARRECLQLERAADRTLPAAAAATPRWRPRLQQIAATGLVLV